MNDQYSHLSQDVRGLLDLPIAERIHHIRKSRYIEYEEARRVREWADRMILGPRTVRPPCLMIAADSDAGKTSILLKLQRCYPDQSDPQSALPHRTIVMCDVEPRPEIDSLQQTLLTCLGAPLLELRTRRLRNDLIGRYLRELHTRIVIFDELQHLEHQRPRERKVLMDWIKWISTSAHVHVICAGVRGIELLTQLDPQLSTRFQVLHLPRWTPGAACGAFLQAYEHWLPLRRPSRLWDLQMQRTLIEESRGMQSAPGITGGIVRIIQEAAIAAIASGREQIDRELLQAWRDPVPVPQNPQAPAKDRRPRVDRMQMRLPWGSEGEEEEPLLDSEMITEH